MKTTIAFPGLGIEEFELNRAAFTIPIGDGITVYWYGIIIALGIILAFTYFLWRATKFEHVREDDCYNLALFTVPIAIIGARILYVITNPEKYDSLLDAISIWNGGIAIYGAIIFGAITILVFGKVKKIMVFRLLDAVSPAVMIGQIMGRWGNFTNGEAFGAETASMFRMGLSHLAGQVQTYVHPTFLYESLWNLTGFVLINVFYKKKRFDGQWLFAYIAWYGLGRGFIETLRQDSLYIGTTDIRVSSLLGFLLFFFAVGMLIFFSLKPHILGKEEEFYYPEAKGFAVLKQQQAVKEEANDTETEDNHPQGD